MAGTIIVNGQNVTLRFDYTTTATVATNTAGAAAEELFDRGLGDHGTADAPRLFASYTNQERINLLDAYFLQTVNNLARDHNANKAAAAAAAQSVSDSAVNLHL